MVEVKEALLKEAREKWITYKGNPISLSANFSAATLQAIREWKDISKVMQERNLQRRIIYLAKLPLRIEEEMKCFLDKQKVKEFITIKPALQEMLKGL